MANPQVGSLGERPTYVDSVDADVKAGGIDDSRQHTESPVLGLSDASNKEIVFPSPPTNKSASKPSQSWLSDDSPVSPSTPIGPAAPPTSSSPAHTIQDIYIPSRFSSSTPAANKKRLYLQRRLSADVTSYNMSAPQELQQARPSGVSQTSTATPRSSHSTRGAVTGQSTAITSTESVMSLEASAPSLATEGLAPLQHKENMDEAEKLSPLLEDDPKCFDLVDSPHDNGRSRYSLETRSEQLFSREHLEAIFKDTASLLRFTTFLNATRPRSVPVLNYYLTALKALQAIKYANAVSESLQSIPGLEFSESIPRFTANDILQEKADSAFDMLVRDDLPAFVTYLYIQIVSVSITKRVTGNMPVMLREASEGLAEVFCLTDPSRHDNPIIFASEEFHRTTQYGVSYAIGRNCRFLQGPQTNRDTVARLKMACDTGREISEVFLNYRRDGSPFMNLLMMAPLLDSRGDVRYFIGAQIDVSGLVKDSSDLEAFQRMVDQQEGLEDEEEPKSEFQHLSEMFDHSELNTVRKHGGNMHREHFEESHETKGHSGSGQRVLIQDQSTLEVLPRVEKALPKSDGRLSGPYKHYLLIRPAPSLRILFTSPSLRVPGVLQSPFLDRIGGNEQVRESLANALADGSRGVTAKIRWLSHAVPNLENAREEGRPRWIHCTPLLGASGSVGVWMVVLIDEREKSITLRKLRPPPPVTNDIRTTRLQQDSRQNLRDADEFEDDDVHTQNGVMRHGSLHSPTAKRGGRSTPLDPARHLASQLASARRPFSPAQASNNSRFPMMHDQLAVRSANSSVKDYYENGSISSLSCAAISSSTSVASNDRRSATGGESTLAAMIADVPEYFQNHNSVDVEMQEGAVDNGETEGRKSSERMSWQRLYSIDGWPLVSCAN